MPAADVPPEDDEPRPGGFPPPEPDVSAGGAGGTGEGGTDEEEDDCGVTVPIAPHAARGPERLPRGFSGKAPLFPLPGCVFFPHTLLPLHIFEDRYRAMTRDALGTHDCAPLATGERLIAMARLRDGVDSQAGAEPDRPPIHDTVCLGKIVAEDRLPDGRFHLVLRGVVRAAVRSERTVAGGYRLAALAPLPDACGPRPDLDRAGRVRQLLAAFGRLHPDVDLDEILRKAFGRCVTPGMVCDVVASVLQLSPDQSQALLDQTDPDVRADVVLGHLRRRLADAGYRHGRPGPADPSVN